MRLLDKGSTPEGRRPWDLRECPLNVSSKNDDALDDPESRDATDDIRRDVRGPPGLGHFDSPHHLPRERYQDRRNEKRLTNLNALNADVPLDLSKRAARARLCRHH
jgi:hypothetical protein